MTKDNPDTFVMEDQSEWEATQVDDVFLPSVKVLLGWSDIEAAVTRGAIVPSEAHDLWAHWAAPGSPLRRGVGVVDRMTEMPRHDSPTTEEPDTPQWLQSREQAPASSGAGVSMPVQMGMLLAAALVGAGAMYVLSM